MNSTHLAEWLPAALDAREREAQTLLDQAQLALNLLRDHELQLLGKLAPGWHAWPDVKRSAEMTLAEIDAKRRILAEHEPVWRTVEWPHDQNGRGEAQACRRCQNADHSQWNPPQGRADVLPEGFITPYVLAPCPTLRLLAQSYAGWDGWREEWRV